MLLRVWLTRGYIAAWKHICKKNLSVLNLRDLLLVSIPISNLILTVSAPAQLSLSLLNFKSDFWG